MATGREGPGRLAYSETIAGAPAARNRRAHTPESRRGPEADARPLPPGSRGREAIKFFTIPEVAECLNVSTRTVRRWIKRGELIAHRLGGLVRIADSDLRAFLTRYREL
jgi:excisionase family DNA binding protein